MRARKTQGAREGGEGVAALSAVLRGEGCRERSPRAGGIHPNSPWPASRSSRSAWRMRSSREATVRRMPSTLSSTSPGIGWLVRA